MDRGSKRKKSNYYAHKQKKAKHRFVLESGLKGFICTCNNREKECVRESYNILNEYADLIYGEEKLSNTNKPSDAEDSDEDIDKALEEEIGQLKAERQKEPSQRRFQVIDSGANNCLFIRTTVDDPVQLVVSILKDLEATKKQKSRFLLRMLPVEITCKAWPEDIREATNKLLDKHFLGAEKSFSVIFNRRNNSNVPRDDVIKEIAEGVRKRNPLHHADLKNPEMSIIVEIIRNMCCLAVVPDYFRYRKYNLLEVCAEQPVVEKGTDTLKSEVPALDSEVQDNEITGGLADTVEDETPSSELVNIKKQTTKIETSVKESEQESSDTV